MSLYPQHHSSCWKNISPISVKRLYQTAVTSNFSMNSLINISVCWRNFWKSDDPKRRVWKYAPDAICLWAWTFSFPNGFKLWFVLIIYLLYCDVFSCDTTDTATSDCWSHYCRLATRERYGVPPQQEWADPLSDTSRTAGALKRTVCVFPATLCRISCCCRQDGRVYCSGGLSALRVPRSTARHNVWDSRGRNRGAVVVWAWVHLLKSNDLFFFYLKIVRYYHEFFVQTHKEPCGCYNLQGFLCILCWLYHTTKGLL